MWHNIKLLNTATGILWMLCAALLLAAGLIWLAQRPVFALKEIVVRGTDATELRHVHAPTVRSAALPRIKGNFFTVDLDAVRVAFETVPWVRKASVRREWPDRLVVSVEEHQPLGTWGNEGRLLSTKGDVFLVNLAEAEDVGGLLEFSGPKGSEKEVLTRYVELEEWLKPIGLTPVAMELTDRFAWRVKLSNGMMLKLGRDRDQEKLKALVAGMAQVYPKVMAHFGNRIDSLDLRYPNGFAVGVGNGNLGKSS